MEDKKVLNNEELEKVSGGARTAMPGFYLYCSTCGSIITRGVTPGLLREETENAMKKHDCKKGNTVICTGYQS